jgi:ABC-type transporter Mla MlaB component
MFRISKVEGRQRTVLNIDGQLTADCIDAAGACCDQALASGKRVDVFLRNVSSVDSAGGALLCRLDAKGVRLHASGVYNLYMVRRLKRARTQSSKLPVVP